MANERSLISRAKSAMSSDWYNLTAEDRIGSALKQFGENIEKRREEEKIEYSREQATLNTFRTRLNNPVINAKSDSTIYNNKTLDEIEATWDRMYSEDIRRFPKQQADITDIYESKKTELNKYRSLNTNYNFLSSKIPDVKKFLIGMTNRLSDMDWGKLDDDTRIELEKELMAGTKDIATLGKMIKNNAEYFTNLESFNKDKDDVEIGIIQGYNQLLSQIDTLDPDGNIINKRELNMMLETIRDNRPERMTQRLDKITKFETGRITGNARDFDKAHAEWKEFAAYQSDPTSGKELSERNAQYETFLKDLDSKLSAEDIDQAKYDRLHIDYLDNPTNWSSMVHIDKETGQGRDVRTVGITMNRLQDQMDRIDADFKQDTGNEYSKWRGRVTPWRPKERSPDYYEGETVETSIEEPIIDIGETPTVGQKTIDQLVAAGKVFGEDKVGEGATAKRFPSPVIIGETVERNNPGNLRFANQTYATGKDEQGFAVFETAKHGWQALYNQIDKDKTRDLTLEKFINKYAPTSENDTTAYLRNIQRDLKVVSSMNINDINTKELAKAIAKQEGYAGEPPTGKKVKGIRQLTTAQDGKTVVNYDVANTHNFKRQQVNLQDIASNKFKSLSKDDKKNYGNVRDFVKAKYEEWLKKTGKHGKGAWYSEGDFKYFFPTKVGPKGTKTNISGVDIYDLFDRRINMHPAFKKVKGLSTGTTSPSYENFAKDFDAFRKYLQES